MVTATQRRRAVDHLESRRISERRACRLTRFSRSAVWRPLQGRNVARLRSRLKRLAEQYPKYGGLGVSELRRLKRHEVENSRWRKMVPT